MRNRLIYWAEGVSLCALVTGSALAGAPLQLLSVRDPAQPAPAGASGDSWGPVLSPDGRYVLFSSTANNLVQSTSTNPLYLAPRLNVYRRDRATGLTTLVSVNLSGTRGGNDDSFPTAISADGHLALFESSASDLVAGDTNGVTDVFLRDLAGNVTYLVSVNTNGIPGNGLCRGSTMTPDGRYVAFTSAASDLAPGDTNGIPDVFVRDMQSGITTWVSVGAQPTNQYSFVGSEAPDITPDGRYVAFYSAAGNLVPGITNGGEVYVRDLGAAATTWVSQGALALVGTTNTVSFNQAISSNGNLIAYEACTNQAVTPAAARGVILRFHLDTGVTDLVNTNASVQAGNVEEIRSLEITPDGRFITFVANTNVSAGATCIYLWDAQTAAATLVSAGTNGTVAAGSICDWPTVDATGRFVAFSSSATNLVANALVGAFHLYLRDVQSGVTTLLDADTNGVGVSVGAATAPRLSADASLAAFEAFDSSLVANDRNHAYDVFIRDVNPNTITLLSPHDPLLPSSSGNGPSAVTGLAASADGRYLAFTSDADNLVPNDTNGFRDVLVRDRVAGTTILASVATNGAAADGISSEPAISANGRFVAFTSGADNLVPGDGNRLSDVFVRDLQGATTTLVSVNTGGLASGNNASYSPALGADGRFVLFRSLASNLAAGAFSGAENLFLRDLQTSVTYALTFGGVVAASMTPDGRLVAFTDTAGAGAGKIYVWDSLAGTRVETNSLSQAITNLAFSPNAGRIAWLGSGALGIVDRIAKTNGVLAIAYANSRFGLRFSADSRFLTYSAAPSATATNQVYSYDFLLGSNSLLSSASGSVTGGGGNSDSPDMSADGRLVAYRSVATNLLAVSWTNNLPNLFLFDRVTAATTLLTANRLAGGPGNNRSVAPVFSGDGRTFFFQTWASDLIAADFNQTADVLALSFLYALISTAPGQGPTLSWPARPGESYQVQFKNNLGDIPWQDVVGTVTIVGSQAQLTDLSPSAGQRFYRVVAY
jgi:Tol biopolymer transport system component